MVQRRDPGRSVRRRLRRDRHRHLRPQRFLQRTSWTAIGGNVVPATLEGTATVHNDCTGDITYDFSIGGQPAGQTSVHFVIFDHGKRVRGIVADPGWAVTCELAARQQR